jgi:hypothetical protein
VDAAARAAFRMTLLTLRSHSAPSQPHFFQRKPGFRKNPLAGLAFRPTLGILMT